MALHAFRAADAPVTVAVAGAVRFLVILLDARQAVLLRYTIPLRHLLQRTRGRCRRRFRRRDGRYVRLRRHRRLDALIAAVRGLHLAVVAHAAHPHLKGVLLDCVNKAGDMLHRLRRRIRCGCAGADGGPPRGVVAALRRFLLWHRAARTGAVFVHRRRHRRNMAAKHRAGLLPGVQGAQLLGALFLALAHGGDIAVIDRRAVVIHGAGPEGACVHAFSP